MLTTKTPALERPVPSKIELRSARGSAAGLEDSPLAALEWADAADRTIEALTFTRALPSSLLVDVPLTSSKSRNLAPATAILRRHWQQKSSLEEAMLELYFGHISLAKAEEVAGQLWGTAANLGLVSATSRKIAGWIQAWLQREITEPQVYVYFQAIQVKQKIKGEGRFTRLAAAIGVCRKGTRQVLAVMSAAEPAGNFWDGFFRDLKRRGLRGTELFIGENDVTASAAAAAHFPRVRFQGCLLHLEREVLARAPVAQALGLRKAFKDLRASPTEQKALQVTAAAVAMLRAGRATAAAELLEQSAPFQFNHYRFSKAHRSRLNDIGPLRRTLTEFRETIRIIGPVPDDSALTLLLTARLRQASRGSWAHRKFMSF